MLIAAGTISLAARELEEKSDTDSDQLLIGIFIAFTLVGSFATGVYLAGEYGYISGGAGFAIIFIGLFGSYSLLFFVAPWFRRVFQNDRAAAFYAICVGAAIQVAVKAIQLGA